MKKTKIRREEMMRIVGKGDEENVVWREEMMRMVGKDDEENKDQKRRDDENSWER